MPAATPTLTFQIDTAESRVKRDVIVTQLDGRHWDTAATIGGFVDAITNTGMLAPLPVTDSWQTLATGDYARLKKSDYTLTTSANWQQYSRPPLDGNYCLRSLGTNEAVQTTASYEKNRGLWLSWYAHNSGNEHFVQMECGLGEGSTTNIRLRFWSNGKCEVYKNSTFVGEGNIFERKVTTQTVYGSETNSPGATKGDSRVLTGQTVDVLIIPCRHRELLVLSNQGGGFSFTFDDIDPEGSNPTITGAGKFYWNVPTGQADVGCAPLKYETTASLIGPLRSLRAAPATGEVATKKAYYEDAGYGTTTVTARLMEPDGVTNFLPDGTKKQCRLRVDLTGDGTASSWVYGASATFDALFANTDGTHATNLDTWLTEAQLSVPESPVDVTLTLSMNSPDAIQTAGAAQIAGVGNRSLVAKLGTVPVLMARTKMPRRIEGLNDKASHLLVEAGDHCLVLSNRRMKDPVAVDGMTLSAAFAYFAKMAGLTDAELDIEDLGYTLPAVGQTSQGEFALLPEVGDTAVQWIQKLWETYARHTIWGIVPTATGRKFQVKSLDTLNALASVATLYPSDADAIAGGVAARTRGAWYRSTNEIILAPEANDIWVTGQDARTGAPIQSHFADTASQDPTLVPSARPTNWLGEIWYYAWVNSALVTLADTDWACKTISKRITRRRRVREWTCEMILKTGGVPAWRGDVVSLVPYGKYRITTLSADLKNEYADAGGVSANDRIWRPTLYTGEWVAALP